MSGLIKNMIFRFFKILCAHHRNLFRRSNKRRVNCHHRYLMSNFFKINFNEINILNWCYVKHFSSCFFFSNLIKIYNIFQYMYNLSRTKNTSNIINVTLYWIFRCTKKAFLSGGQCYCYLNGLDHIVSWVNLTTMYVFEVV